MIREIMNFTNDLIEDNPIMAQLKLVPQPGLYVFIDIDEDGKWTNEELAKGKDYDYYDGKNQDIKLWDDCIRYQEATNFIEMNKVKAFDAEQKIHSCSPFSVAYNFNFSEKDKERLGIKKDKRASKEERQKTDELIREKKRIAVEDRLKDYRKHALSIYKLDNIEETNTDGTPFLYKKQLTAFYDNFGDYLDKISTLPEYQKLSGKDYLKVFLRSIPIIEQEQFHNKYIEENLLNGEEIEGSGVLGFLTSYNLKKLFVSHRTSVAVKGISYRFSKADALTLNTFEKMWKRKCFPTPLPIVIDKREINSEIVKIFNEKSDPILYKDLIKKLFDRVNEKELSNYYLMNYRNTKGGMVLDDFDFIPLFRYRFDNTLMIENVTGSGFVNGGVFEKDITERIDNVFDFERIVVRTIFNNSLVKIKDDEYKTKYFGDIDSKYVYGGDLMWQLIMKYRKAFYDYIYKSRKNAITTYMFDDMMLTSTLTNIRIDDINTRCEYNNAIKKKINIWFSIYYLFNNNKKETIMASHVTDLLSKMEAVAKGKSNIDSPEEFAFAAGQLASYLIDRSVASNKSYAMLEPYLQKCKSGQLEDAIAQTIAMYKHDISTYKGNFEMLSAQVLTYDNNVDLKPLLKYFLAGCFSHCVIYETRESNNQ